MTQYLGKYGRFEVTTAPATEPVSTADAKAHLRIESSVTDDDTLIDKLVAAARHWVEQYIERKLITQTITQTLDDWPGSSYAGDGELVPVGRVDQTLARGSSGWVELLANPVQSITSVTTYDDAGSSAVWSSSNYRLSDAGDRARMALKDGASWPTNATRRTDAIEIVYVVGYGGASAVPDDIILAIKMLVAHWYENREAVTVGSGAEVPMTVKPLLQPYRYMGF